MEDTCKFLNLMCSRQRMRTETDLSTATLAPNKVSSNTRSTWLTAKPFLRMLSGDLVVRMGGLYDISCLTTIALL